MRRNLVFIVFVLMLFSLTPAFASEDSQFILPQFSQKVSLDFQDADIQDVLRALSRQIGVNFMVVMAGGGSSLESGSSANPPSPGAPSSGSSSGGRRSSGGGMRITVYLEDVPVEEALNKILLVNGLVYEYDQNANIIIVKSAPSSEYEKKVTRVYQLKYATVDSSKLKSMSGSGGSSSDSKGESSSSSAAGPPSPSGSKGSSSSGSSSSSSSSSLSGVLGSVLTANGKIAEDSRTNSIIITDILSNFPLIERTIARLDVPVAQILIEVEMLDVSKTTTDKMGVKFGSTLTDGSFLKMSSASMANSVAFPFTTDVMKGYNGVTRIVTPGADGAPDTVTTTVPYPKIVAPGSVTSGLTAALNFLRTQGDTRALARPRILTLDNETSRISIGGDEVTGVTTTIDADGKITEVIERMKVGVSLTVTPQANHLNSEITMAMEAKVIITKDSAFQSRAAGGTFLKNPEERNVTGILTVQSGDTIVIGGLLRQDDQKTTTSLPILGDIPFLGALFRSKDNLKQGRELIVFLTPRILDNANMADGFKSVSDNGYLSGREQSMPDIRIKSIDDEMDNIIQKRKGI